MSIRIFKIFIFLKWILLKVLLWNTTFTEVHWIYFTFVCHVSFCNTWIICSISSVISLASLLLTRLSCFKFAWCSIYFLSTLSNSAIFRVCDMQHFYLTTLKLYRRELLMPRSVNCLSNPVVFSEILNR